MNDIVIFGASQEGAYALECLRENWNILAFCDNDHCRWGTQYCGVPIISASELKSIINNVCVVVANSRYEKILTFQLWELGIQSAYLFKGVNGGYQLDSLNFLDNRSRFSSVVNEVCNKINNIKKFDIYEREPKFNSEKKRIFFFTIYNNAGKCGGPQGVMYRLQQANQKYKLLNNDFYIFGDRAVLPLSCVRNSDAISTEYNHQSIADAVYSLWNDCNDKEFRLHHFEALVDRLAFLQSYYERLCSLHEIYGFSYDDIYVFHDVEAAFVFNCLFTIKHQALVYHNQGGLYYEYLAFNGKLGEGLSWSWYLIHKHCLGLSRFHVFPSMGGVDALQQTCPELSPYIKTPTIIHNGCELDNFSASENIRKKVDTFILEDTLTFVTVAMINDAKAIDRIPVFLANLKKKGIDNFQWILIGDGPCREQLDIKICQLGLSDLVLWIKDRLPYEDIQYVLSKSQFYIILQKYSICDFATIEAMGRGCIPVLSDVPGNLPYLTHCNGVAVKDYNDPSFFFNFLKTTQLDVFRNKNISIQNTYFSDFSFLTGYHDLTLSFDEK
ncbi:glycosyltransferase [Aeromonas enteropelogenes]|uniref:glycosyltransferase n=1 Tax=Aeromonas enteropelogenes TaxID=29489 RepID=UPI001CCFB081|nr:glycosyltransferase [Aeromonas enteropelogenes]UBH29533.1 glycosyltransferase [Aeromonas enteropelogenes]